MFNIFKNYPSKDCKESKNINANFGNNSYFYSIGTPVWSERNYNQFAGHVYIKKRYSLQSN
ncbi:MAG: hypothetical protein MRQ09_02235 [Candidatus Midichloria sp.]|nr:hypothetical protein [Candidatus Midichloria sp.]